MKQSKGLAIAIGVMFAGAAFGPAAFAQTSSTHQQDQQWQQMNANGNGKVSRSEYDHYWKRQFKQADTNQDGKLSRQECQAAVKKMQGANFSQTRFDEMWNNVSQHGYITPSQDLAYHNKQFDKASHGNNTMTKAEFEHTVNTGSESVASL